MTHQPRLFWRAVLAFIALPTTVAFVVPWMLRPSRAGFELAGAPVFVIGVTLLLWCMRDFYVAGRGTLAPWAPPEHLVTCGLYRVSRNPMYLAVLVMLCGWALSFPSPTLWAYAACVAVGFHIRVFVSEEPYLARVHGAAWRAYRAQVPRWLGFPGRRARYGWLTNAAPDKRS